MKMKGDAEALCTHGHSFGVPNTSLFSVEPRWYPPVPMLYAERSAACHGLLGFSCPAGSGRLGQAAPRIKARRGTFCVFSCE